MQTIPYTRKQEVLLMNNNVKKIRIERGMSVSELARRTGLSRTAINNIENQESNPLASTMYAISIALDKKVSEIFFAQGVMQE